MPLLFHPGPQTLPSPRPAALLGALAVLRFSLSPAGRQKPLLALSKSCSAASEASAAFVCWPTAGDGASGHPWVSSLPSGTKPCTQNHRIPAWQGWKGPLWVPQPNPLPKQGHPEQAAQHRVQAGLEYLQGRRLHSLPGQPGPGLPHPQREEVLPRVLLPSEGDACWGPGMQLKTMPPA